MAIDKTGMKGQTRIEGTLLQQGLWSEVLTGDETLDSDDVGKVLLVQATGKTITLPATATGLKFLIVYDGPVNGTLTVDPDGADEIMGVDLNMSAGDALELTNAQPGDLVEVAYANSDGYFVTKIAGNWTEE